MTEDQFVVGQSSVLKVSRRTKAQRAYGALRRGADQGAGFMNMSRIKLNDSEEDMVDEEEDTKEFVEAEDKIIRMTIEELGSSDVVYDSLAQSMSRKPCEVKARYEALVSQQNAIENSNSWHTDLNMSWSIEEDLEVAQDSFDNLFCQRFLIFDFMLSPNILVRPKRTWNGMDEDIIPCGPHCYLKVPNLDGNAGTSPIQLDIEQKTALSSDACN
ncbi:SET domain-containing protein [Tanacetum coccineum]